MIKKIEFIFVILTLTNTLVDATGSVTEKRRFTQAKNVSNLSKLSFLDIYITNTLKQKLPLHPL